MGTQAELWTLETLKSARSDENGYFEVDEKRPVVFTIPAFQRSLVWPESKQRALISSILKGFPFGALLLVEYDGKKSVTLPSGTKVNATNYGIIDGLQRTNAIVEHLRRSLVFATSDVLEGAEFEALLQELDCVTGQSVDREKLTDGLVAWMHATREPDVTLGFDFDSLLQAVASALGVQPFTGAAVAALKPKANALIKHIGVAVDISTYQIPVLVYNGPSEYLPDIFEQINTAGTMLSKYEVFAAAWVSTEVEVASAEIRKAISRRYKGLEDEGFSVDVAMSGTSFSLFDYLHGLSQYLGEKYPILFSQRDAARNKLSAAFPLATLMLGQSLDKMASLDKLFTTDKGKLDVAGFEKALLASADIVNQILSPFLAFKFTSDSEALPHGELQMVSMVGAVAGLMFDHTRDFKDRGTAPARAKLRKLLEKAVPQHYIYDILRQQWRGSLYTYAAERVWDGASPSKVYTKPVDLTSFNGALTTSFAEQMNDVTHKRQNVTAADRVFLKFLYSPVVSVADQQAHKFDVEHLIPVSRIQAMTKNKDPWAIGAIGNLAVLPAGPNRIKQNETVTEYFARTAKAPTAAIKTLVRKMILVKFDNIAIPKKGATDAMTKGQYDKVVKANWQAMCKQLRTNIDL